MKQQCSSCCIYIDMCKKVAMAEKYTLFVNVNVFQLERTNFTE